MVSVPSGRHSSVSNRGSCSSFFSEGKNSMITTAIRGRVTSQCQKLSSSSVQRAPSGAPGATEECGVEKVMGDDAPNTAHTKSRTVSAMDVVNTLKRPGRALYSFS
ncbi:histone H4, major-like [Perca fluviatilis]|uniref:histone H4, major-like n=1 Tax=Perca fluviatilis TaxID=8168 RepID=UPI0019623D09|nr:histone H4, major-like [Perca fluviatilis]